MDLKLSGKSALVTGASQGLGYAIALGLAKEGVNIALNSRNEENLTTAVERLREETNVKITLVPGDVTEATASEKIVGQVVHNLGGIDLLVTNSAGPPPGRFESFKDEQWYQSIDLVFMSHVRMIRAALPYLRDSSAASVLTLTSYAVKQPIPNLVLSNSIRAATIGLTKSLALELGTDNIRFNSILPAWTETERVYQLMSDRAQRKGTSVQDEINQQAKESPLGRLCKPEEVANAAVFLLSPAASYITGVMLTVDGGMNKGIF